MLPRLLTRTHYQVDEPAYLKVLILECTSPTRSDYQERIASCFVQLLGKQQRIINLPAAKYAADLARGLGILTDNWVWSDLGHLFKIICSPSEDTFTETLNLPERILFFRLFFEADGGALLFIARTLAKTEILPPKERTWNDFANEMVSDVYTDYRDFAIDVPSRTRIRQVIERRQSQPFSGKSGAHQSFIHVQALYRMGLLDKADQGNSRCYKNAEYQAKEKSPLEVLLELVPNIRVLEQVIKDRTWPRVAQDVFAGQLMRSSGKREAVSTEKIFREFREIYDMIMETDVVLCPLKTLVESLQIRQIAESKFAVGYGDALEVLKTVQKRHPREVRFHVDRGGQPAYIKLADSLKV